MMCKKLTIGLLVFEVMLIIAFCLAGCCHAVTESVSGNAMIKLPDGSVVEGFCSKYEHLEKTYRYCISRDGMIAVTIDGVKYTTHVSNVVFIER